MSEAESTCARAGRLIGGCRFRPRYDTVAATTPDVFSYVTGGPAARPTPARSTYICDVCERCGKTLFRRKPNATAAKGTQQS